MFKRLIKNKIIIISIIMIGSLIFICVNLQAAGSIDKSKSSSNVTSKIDEDGVYYNSRDISYKKPFGAVAQGKKITINITTKVNNVKSVELVVEKQKITGNIEKVEYLDKKTYCMAKTKSNDTSKDNWKYNLTFKEIGVYTYYFILKNDDNSLIYGNNSSKLGSVTGLNGKGKVYGLKSDVIRYRQTVYASDFKVPDYASDMVYYQIFPDRFKNGDKSNDQKTNEVTYGNRNLEFHKNWIDTPYKPGDSDGSTIDDDIWNNDFFGGDLAGVKQKLPYLKNLGINTIYFNPIFTAPSNHKYDTADYMNVDPHLGSNSFFKGLVSDAKSMGIRIVLDTSFNHCSSDSIYLNRYKTYKGVSGAFEGEQINIKSPFYSWFDFNPSATNPDGMYSGWMGYSDLANINEVDSFKDFAFKNSDSVSKFWMKLGIGAWRMDVTPYVSDDFWREWRKEVKEKDYNFLTISEVWTDSSKYLLGDMFDTNMNYLFREALLNYATGGNAKDSLEMFEMIRESYPQESFKALMNLISSHDVERSLYRFGYTSSNNSTDVIKEAKDKYIMSTFFQMTYPGAPSIYYGEEVGLTGGSDPFNRGTYPWAEDGGNPDLTMLSKVKSLVKLRDDNEILRRGSIVNTFANDSIIVTIRTYKGKVAIIAVNNSNTEKQINIKLSDIGNMAKITLENIITKSNIKLDKENSNFNLTVPAYYGNVLLEK